MLYDIIGISSFDQTCSIVLTVLNSQGWPVMPIYKGIDWNTLTAIQCYSISAACMVKLVQLDSK